MKYFKLLRVNHYLKNFLIFMPLFFNKSILVYEKISISILGFMAFSFVSSIVYIINDIRDIEKDRNHPVKKNRPTASGEISIKKSIIIAIIPIILGIISISIMFIIYKIFNYNVLFSSLLLILYLILNIMYSFGLKTAPIIDIIILVSGFVIRVLFGGAIINVEISSWLCLTIIAISFYLAIGKRRNELVNHEKKQTREVLKFYNESFLDNSMNTFLTLAIMFYSLWTMTFEDTTIIWTVPIVMILVLKYSYNISQNSSEGDPTEVILKDKFIIILGIVLVGMLFLILY